MDIKLDRIYDRIDKLMWDNNLKEIDNVDMKVAMTCQDIDAVLAYLTATLPVKTKLKNRDSLYQHAYHLLLRAGEEAEAILKGLE